MLVQEQTSLDMLGQEQSIQTRSYTIRQEWTRLHQRLFRTTIMKYKPKVSYSKMFVQEQTSLDKNKRFKQTWLDGNGQEIISAMNNLGNLDIFAPWIE